MTIYQEFIFALCVTVIMFSLMELMMNGLVRLRKPTKMYVTSKWRDCTIEKIPSHKFEDRYYFELIITDGKKVTTCSSNFLRYNEKGQVIMGFEQNPVTHWRYMPTPKEEGI